MPSRKSVRFEDLDDGIEDGVYGLKVRTGKEKSSACMLVVFLWRVVRARDFVCLDASLRPSSYPATVSLTPPHRHLFQSHQMVQGMFNKLYAQATSYGKWARSHSKTVRECLYGVDRNMSFPLLEAHPALLSPSLPPSRPYPGV